MKYTILFIVAFFWVGCDDSSSAGGDPCKDVDCGAHGVCAEVNDTPDASATRDTQSVISRASKKMRHLC